MSERFGPIWLHSCQATCQTQARYSSTPSSCRDFVCLDGLNVLVSERIAVQEHVDYIEAVAAFSANCLKEASFAPPKEMRKVVDLLYDAMLKLDFGASAQDAIARLCEAWYAGKLEDHEQVREDSRCEFFSESVCVRCACVFRQPLWRSSHALLMCSQHLLRLIFPQVVPATIVYLLTKSVHEIGKINDVKRVCAMRESLQLLDISPGEASSK
jgi:hypothetical protein